jgi:adenosylmethionine-8-amino-7-oxononanoate aminotransferase
MKIDHDRVPTSLEDAVELLWSGIPPDERSAWARDPDLPNKLHHDLGRWIRNNWSLWDPETHLAQRFRQDLKIGHPDDISGMILEVLSAKARGVPFNARAYVNQCHEHWRAFGCNEFGEDLEPQ